MNYKANELKKITDEIKSLEINQIDFDYIDSILKNYEMDERKNIQAIIKSLTKFKSNILEEKFRTKEMYSFDRNYTNDEIKLICGIDEVGRGPLAGPIVAASVIMDLSIADDEFTYYINDSKTLSKSKREYLSDVIKEKAISYSISEVSNEIIDIKGISHANNMAFVNSCNSLKVRPDFILTDGYSIKGTNIKNDFVIKGDTKSLNIAAASIIAKVYRDNLMAKYHEEFPQYGFLENVGYGTKQHIEAIKKFGITKIHRKSFLKSIM